MDFLRRITVDSYRDKKERKAQRKKYTSSLPTCNYRDCKTLLYGEHQKVGLCKSHIFSPVYLIAKKSRIIDEMVETIIQKSRLIESQHQVINELSIKANKTSSAYYDINDFPRVLNKQESTCIICLEDIKQGEYYHQIPCSHKYHSHCLTLVSFTNNNCPICRRNL